MAKKRVNQVHFHRSQIIRAQQFIRLSFDSDITLESIARQAGSSCYHFARLFSAFTGETPFEFLRRLRIAKALGLLQTNLALSITDVAFDVGYDTSAAFNKVFKKAINMSPGDFRKIGKEDQRRITYDLTRPRIQKEIIVNLSTEFDVVSRPLTHYIYLERRGPFAEIAPPAWEDFFKLSNGFFNQDDIVEWLGLSTIDKSELGEEAMIYQAGVALRAAPNQVSAPLGYRELPGGNYARFVLTGPYSQIWMAFNHAFKVLADSSTALRPEYCIENYLNNPRVVPEEKLLTEILIPVV